MDAKSFVYWLNGYFELTDTKSLDERQIRIIKEHIQLVLNKVTPTSYDGKQPDTLRIPTFLPNEMWVDKIIC